MKYIYLAIAFALVFLLAFWLGYRNCKTTIVTRIDTVTVLKPQVHDSTIIESYMVKVPVHDTVLSENIKFITHHDTIYLSLNRESKHYQDTLYDAWISGIESSLDSIKVYNRTIVQTPKPRVRLQAFGSGLYSFPDFSIQAGLQLQLPSNTSFKAGYNYTPNSSHHGPFLGVTQTFNIIN